MRWGSFSPTRAGSCSSRRTPPSCCRSSATPTSATSSTSPFIEPFPVRLTPHNHPIMKNQLLTLAALALLPAAFAAEEPARLAKILVTGSLQDSAAESAKLDKFLVTGSLQDAAAPAKLEKFIVTGSLEDPAGAPQKLEKFLVTGSPEDRPAVKLRHRR